MMSKPVVKQLLIGDATDDVTSDWCCATCSVTLVLQNEMVLLVDCGSPWDYEKIIKVLKDEGLSPENVTHFVGTHGHMDHIGNLNLFTNAQIALEGDWEKKPNCYQQIDWTTPQMLSSDVKLISTPGHTAQDISVIVRNTDQGTVVIAGDIFECEADLQDGTIWKQSSMNIEKQLSSRKRILEIADFIIPGHGSMFRVNNYKLLDK